MPEPSRTQQFLGRSAELASFERAVADAGHGLPSVLLVWGDAGIGKSRLVDEGAARAGVALHLGRWMHMGGDAIPLAPLADLLRRVRRSRSEALTGPSPSAGLERWLMPEPDSAPGTGPSLGSLFVAVLDLVGRLAADDPAAVGFEDLHWADTVTWDLFEFLPATSSTTGSCSSAPTGRTRSASILHSAAAWPSCPAYRPFGGSTLAASIGPTSPPGSRS